MCIYVYVYVYVYVSVNMYMYMYMYRCMSVHIHIYIYGAPPPMYLPFLVFLTSLAYFRGGGTGEHYGKTLFGLGRGV